MKPLQAASCPILNDDLSVSPQEKCAQYWPTSEELQMSFTDTGFVVRLLSEEDQSHYTIRVLELENTKVSMR